MKINVYFNGKLLTNSFIDHKINKKNVKVVENSTEFLSSRENIINYFEKFDQILIENISSEELLASLKRIFKGVNAAGGVVKNSNGDTLMIYRNSMWDLPKGKQEKGEKIETCAVREVEEECGIKIDSLGDKICDTYHIYYMFETWVVKTTSWFNMKCISTEGEKPQTEEGITEIRWIKESELLNFATMSYPTIAEVLKF